MAAGGDIGAAVLRQLRMFGPLKTEEVDGIVANFFTSLSANEVCASLGDAVVFRSRHGSSPEWVLRDEDAIGRRMKTAPPTGIPLAKFSRSERLLIRELPARLHVYVLENSVRPQRAAKTVLGTLIDVLPHGYCAFALSQLYKEANAELHRLLDEGRAFAIGHKIWASPGEVVNNRAKQAWEASLT